MACLPYPHTHDVLHMQISISMPVLTGHRRQVAPPPQSCLACCVPPMTHSPTFTTACLALNLYSLAGFPSSQVQEMLANPMFAMSARYLDGNVLLDKVRCTFVFPCMHCSRYGLILTDPVTWISSTVCACIARECTCACEGGATRQRMLRTSHVSPCLQTAQQGGCVTGSGPLFP